MRPSVWVYLPVVEGCPGQHHGVFVGPLGGVAPAGSGVVPVVAPGGVAHNALWETLPHAEGKVHLGAGKEWMFQRV